MKVRVFYPNKDNKIEFTKQQLEKLLDEVYEEGRSKGYSEGYNNSRLVTIPYPYTPYWYCTTSSELTCSNSLNNDTINNITLFNDHATAIGKAQASSFTSDSGISIGDEH